MRVALLAPLVAFLSFFHGPSYPAAVTRVQSSIVRITGATDEGGTYVCTGFVIAPNRVLTAAHCVADAMIADGTSVNVLKKDTSTDLAVLNVFSPKSPLVLRERQAERFENATPIGYAFGWTTIYAMQAHVALVDISPAEDIAPGLILDQACIGGQSGGPIVDDTGSVIGIVQQSAKSTCFGVGTLIIRAFLVGVK